MTKTAYLFDVDGVLTNLQTRRVELTELFDEIIKRLELGDWIGFNTGRTFEFLIEKVLEPLESKIVNKSFLQRIFVCGEKGGVWLYYDESGKRVLHVASEFQVPKELVLKVRELIEGPPYDSFVYYDETKRTMLTLELRTDKTVQEFSHIQPELGKALLELVENQNLSQEWVLDISSIASEIQSILAGKDLGVRRFVAWLHSKGEDPQKYIAFGDSFADYAMFSEFKRLGKEVIFVFVGDRHLLKDLDCEHVIFPRQSVDKGTLSFLKNEKLIFNALQ